MIIKKYIVNNMNEALTRIRYELGKDAIILSQRKVRKGGFLGFFSKKMIEVTAATDSSKTDSKESMQEGIEAIKKLMNNKANDVKDNNIKFNQVEETVTTKMEESNKASKGDNEVLVKELQEMKSILTGMVNSTTAPAVQKSDVHMKLENSDVDDKTIDEIVKKAKELSGDKLENEKVKEVISSMVKVSPKREDNVIVLVGPTGVGKTTTIAKLAGRLSLIENKKVGLITIDTYRIGAVEQLKTYADIMNIPFKVVFTMKDMEAAIDSMSDCDAILVDTTGRSSKNAMQISELRAFIDKVKTENIHLVISCTTKNKDIDVIVNGYKQLNFNNIIITKLDETTTYGSILNIVESAKKPISFITTGQNVPDDIKILTSEEITKLILGEDNIC